MTIKRTPSVIGPTDPDVARKLQANLKQAAVIANGRPTVSQSELILPSTTVRTSPTAITLTTSANNQPSDTVTVYPSSGNVYVSSIDQTIKQTVVNQTGVYSIIAGNNISISSTGAGGTGNVTITSLGGEIIPPEPTANGTFSTLPDFLQFVGGTLVRTGQTGAGVFFDGNAGDGNISYPVRTNFSIPGDTKVTVIVDMVVNDECSDFGLCVFEDNEAGIQPEWDWNPNPTRIAGSYNCTTPHIYTLDDSIGSEYDIPEPGIYRVRFTYDPNNSPNVTLETLNLDNDVLDTISINGTLNISNFYYIGFSADQDSTNLRTYIQNLYISIDGGDEYGDSLQLGGGINPFNQSLNTYDYVTFEGIDIYSGVGSLSYNTTSNIFILENNNEGGDIELNADNGGNSWIFGADGSLSIPTAGQIINTGQIWTFGSDGNLNIPGVADGFAMNNVGSVGYSSNSPFSDGSGSLNFPNDNNLHYLNVLSAPRFAPDTGDFTIEWYQYMTSDSHGYQRPFSLGNLGTSSRLLTGLLEGGSTVMGIQTDGLYTAFNGYANNLNSWQHIAVVRNAGNITIYQNGVAIATHSIPVNISYNPASYVSIGNPTGGPESIGTQFVGQITNMRYVVGTAVYTSDFTPSTTPLTVIPGTQLLLLASTPETINIALGDGQSQATAIESSGGINVISNGNVWTFGSDGNLTVPGNIIIDNMLLEANISSDTNINIISNNNVWTFNDTGVLTLPGDVSLPLTVKLNSGGIGITNSAEFGTEVTVDGSNVITDSQIYMGAGTAESRAIVNSAGNSFMYTGVENPGFAGMVSLDPGVTSEYAIQVGANNEIQIGAVIGAITTSEYVAGLGVLNATGNINGIFANANVAAIGAGNLGWLFSSDGNTSFPAVGTADLGNLAIANNFSTNGSGGDITLTGGNINGANVVAANTFLGTGNLHLQPDPANTSAYLNVYLTGGPDVHIAGNGENLILGSDASSNVMIGTDGNVTIQANTVTPHTWTFGSDGNLTVPSWIDGANTYFTGAIAGNVLTVTNAVDGTIARGQTLYGTGVAANTVITLQLTESSANPGGNGTYRVTGTQTVTTEQMFVNSLYLDGDLKLAADHGVYVRDAHDPYQYDNLIGISEVDATILIGSINTNGVTLDNNKEYKVDSALNPGTYMAVAKVNAADEVILSSGNSANTLIRVGGDSATTGYAVKFLNGGEGLMPVGLRIGDNTNSSIFAAPLEVGSRLQGAPNNQSSPGGIALPTYRGTGTIIANDEWGSYLYGSRYRGTINSPLPVKDGDWLMEFGATAFDGTNNNGGGEIAFRVDGSVTGSSNPSKIEFYNTLTGANNQSLGMVLDASQKLTVTGNIAGANISTTGNISGNTNGYTIGYLNIPQVAASNTTIALSDAGKHYYSTSAGNFTLTIPNNASASFATGTAISIVVQSAGNVLVNAVSGVTLYMAGNSTAANRVVSNYGMATLMKVATDTWMINGTGVA